MLSLKFVREHPDEVRAAVSHRGETVDVDGILELDKDVRNMIQDVEGLKARKNRESQRISEMKRSGDNTAALVEEMQTLSETIKEKDTLLSELKGKLYELLLWVPNIPHESVPVGEDESANVELKKWGTPVEFDFDPLDHLELGSSLGLLDFERAAKISGSGFPLYTGKGAMLERALINFMLDHHAGRGYVEISPPLMTLRSATEATGQLPKLEDDMYSVGEEDLFLIPTAEVPVTNIHRDEILKEEDLPVRYVSYTPCFRREAGSYGREARGLIRVHQFNKVELVEFVVPETSYDELESLTEDAESVLQALGLHYRVVALNTGDISFAASKCYDLEVWAPAEKRWLEVSSCSNFESFQARRANIRYRKADGKLDFVHTLNGSGVATARLMVALLESYQTEEGTIMVPEVLHPYTDVVVVK